MNFQVDVANLGKVWVKFSHREALLARKSNGALEWLDTADKAKCEDALVCEDPRRSQPTGQTSTLTQCDISVGKTENVVATGRSVRHSKDQPNREFGNRRAFINALKTMKAIDVQPSCKGYANPDIREALIAAYFKNLSKRDLQSLPVDMLQHIPEVKDAMKANGLFAVVGYASGKPSKLVPTP